MSDWLIQLFSYGSDGHRTLAGWAVLLAMVAAFPIAAGVRVRADAEAGPSPRGARSVGLAAWIAMSALFASWLGSLAYAVHFAGQSVVSFNAMGEPTTMLMALYNTFPLISSVVFGGLLLKYVSWDHLATTTELRLGAGARTVIALFASFFTLTVLLVIIGLPLKLLAIVTGKYMSGIADSLGLTSESIQLMFQFDAVFLWAIVAFVAVGLPRFDSGSSWRERIRPLAVRGMAAAALGVGAASYSLWLAGTLFERYGSPAQDVEFDGIVKWLEPGSGWVPATVIVAFLLGAWVVFVLGRGITARPGTISRPWLVLALAVLLASSLIQAVLVRLAAIVETIAASSYGEPTLAEIVEGIGTLTMSEAITFLMPVVAVVWYLLLARPTQHPTAWTSGRPQRSS